MNQELSFYPEGVSFELEIDPDKTLLDLFRTTVAQYQDSCAFESFSVPLTFSELDKHSLAFASYLQNELGVKKGDRVALMAPNCIPFVVAMWGIIRCGAIQVNVNPLYTPTELKHQLVDSDAATIVIFSGSTPVLAEIVEQTPIENIICLGLDDLLNKQIPSPGIDSRLKGMKHFVQCLTSVAPGHFKSVTLTQADPVFLQYTGGTTGISKGAVLTQGNIVANIEQFLSYCQNHLEPGREVVLTAIPMYHIFALTVNAISFFVLGAKNILITNPRDLDQFIGTWKASPVTVFTGVNTLYNGLLHHPEFNSIDFSTLRFCVGGGASIQAIVSKRWYEVTAQPIYEGYGLSETSPVVCLNLGKHGETVSGIGLPLPNTEIRLINEKSEAVEEGERGELCVRGPQVMPGYWNNDQATAEVFTEDGFFKTGDVAKQDADGFYHIVDRIKDMVIVSGFNVYPNEIEGVASAMDGVLECACVGVPDEKTGEAVKLFVVKSDESITEADIIEYCSPRLTAYKVPKVIQFLPELPKSTVGKVLRRSLR